MPIPLKNVQGETIKIINFVISRPLSTRLFTILYEDTGSIHKSLTYYYFTIPKYNGLLEEKHLYAYFNYTMTVRFFTEHPFNLQFRRTDKIWLFRLSYLADIFTKLNEVNVSIRGKITSFY